MLQSESAGDEVPEKVLGQPENGASNIIFIPKDAVLGQEVCFTDLRNDNGEIVLSELDKLITDRTKLISVVHMSNFTGTINPVEKIGDIARKNNVLFLIDGAQSAPHIPVDVKRIGCDFFAFSAHKMVGPTGIGALYGRKELLEKMKPFIGGGDMIKTVSYEGFEPNNLPWKYEAGTAK